MHAIGGSVLSHRAIPSHFLKLDTMPKQGAAALLPGLIGMAARPVLCLKTATTDAHEATAPLDVSERN
ncbi:MAG: hypothetical protein P0Y64_13520 [Candidatus Sphingomonas colombiensis]|nr:hypothetical protein [Sphingomonas sp.]WEK42403.1 MAG: hypothetical protein P0Y64_13520 [Sphingomonas sp.]